MSRDARVARLHKVSFVCAAFAATVGAVVLAGWILDNDALKGSVFSGITMKANTAVAHLAIGASLALLAPEERSAARTWVGRGFAVFAAVLGLATLSQHLFGWNLGIDQFLFREAPGSPATQSPNRMGPPASTCFPLLGLALLALDREPRGRASVSQRAALLVAAASLVSVLGYMFNVQQLFGIAKYTGISFPTAVTFIVVAVGIYSARPTWGPMGRLVADDSGALLVRRLVPAAILLPIGLMYVRVLGERAGLYDLYFGRALVVFSFIAIFAGLVWVTGGVITRQEHTAQNAEAALRNKLFETIAVLERAQLLLGDSDRRKNEFLATLAHELRNPLAPVRNAVEILRTPGTQPGEAQWAHAVIDRQVDHLTRLIDDLMDVSRITHDKLELRKSPTTLQEIVSGAVESSRHAIDESRHRLKIELPDESIHLDADAIRLVQVFMNLLTNAAKYTPPGGRITLTAVCEGPEVVVRVADTGVGIAPDHMPHLFEMFYQTEEVRQRSKEGLGIGLALVRHLVRLHGGTVDVESAGRGEGSVFTVRLPLATEPAVAAPRGAVAPDRSQRLRSRKALVVDDNTDAAESLGFLLRFEGAEVETAHDGDEALTVAERVKPDLVLLDIGLPKRNGYDVAREIRGFEWGAQSVIIAMTGWGQPHDRARSREAGFDHHLVKPVSLDTILDLVDDPSRET